jgi:hypothetical protein
VWCKKQKFLISLTSLQGAFGWFWPFLGLKIEINYMGLFFGQKPIGAILYGRFGASVMQKTEVFDIINLFIGPLWPILVIFGPKKWGQFFGPIILLKNYWDHALGKIWG